MLSTENIYVCNYRNGLISNYDIELLNALGHQIISLEIMFLIKFIFHAVTDIVSFVFIHILICTFANSIFDNRFSLFILLFFLMIPDCAINVNGVYNEPYFGSNCVYIFCIFF